MLCAFVAVSTLVQQDWKTEYEKSNYLRTGTYQEAVDYCNRIEKASPDAHVLHFGISPQGRDMVALLLTKERDYTPQGLSKSKKALVFVNNGIHSGEIEGKDASLMLAREIAVTKSQQGLLEHTNILIIPIFSVDAHERSSPYNRINQNGPEKMGWRVTAQNLNLNRDFIKADAPEMQSLLRLISNYKPDFFFDNHTTDGADFQYTVTTGVPVNGNGDPGVAAWSRTMLAAVTPKVESEGFLMGPYFGLNDRSDPTKGISVEDFSPRYSNGYLFARNRPSMLIETHVLKPYKQRVDATYSLVKHTIQYCADHSDDLRKANAAADNSAAAMKPGTEVVLGLQATDEKRPFTFKGYEYTPHQSEVTGKPMASWTHNPKDFPSFVQDSYKPSVVVKSPAGYAIPAEFTYLVGLLQVHGIAYSRTVRPVSGVFATYRFEDVTFPKTPFEGRFMPTYKTIPIQEERTLAEGSIIVRTAQPLARLVMHLLEPEGPDSLEKWGFFNGFFEQKEYFEDYAMEPIAQKMLDSDPKLKAEFEEKLKDPKFAANPRARLDFFFQHSPYVDQRLNKYPIVRLDVQQLEAALGKE